MVNENGETPRCEHLDLMIISMMSCLIVLCVSTSDDHYLNVGTCKITLLLFLSFLPPVVEWP